MFTFGGVLNCPFKCHVYHVVTCWTGQCSNPKQALLNNSYPDSDQNNSSSFSGACYRYYPAMDHCKQLEDDDNYLEPVKVNYTNKTYIKRYNYISSVKHIALSINGLNFSEFKKKLLFQQRFQVSEFGVVTY